VNISNQQSSTTMIELHNDELVFTFPELGTQLKSRAHAWIDELIARATDEEKARLPSSQTELYGRFAWCIPKVRASVSLQRTLRIPDDSKDYPLPPGLGRFPIRHVDDFTGVPEHWRKHGGVMVPMHRTEAMWLDFSADYPMALMVGAGQICAVSGERWTAKLNPATQNYVVLPEQPWLDGFRASGKIIRQFVAVPMGKGLTVEQQLTGQENWGGLQLQAFPLKIDRYPVSLMETMLRIQWNAFVRSATVVSSERIAYARPDDSARKPVTTITEAGLGAGGRMRQEIVVDEHGVGAWDTSLASRCFVHLCLADDWRRLTGSLPPHPPPTAKDYAAAGLPWFDYNSNKPAIAGSTPLTDIKSVNTLVGEKTGLVLPDNETIHPADPIILKKSTGRPVRED
jgi:hypothetical protein